MSPLLLLGGAAALVFVLMSKKSDEGSEDDLKLGDKDVGVLSFTKVEVGQTYKSLEGFTFLADKKYAGVFSYKVTEVTNKKITKEGKSVGIAYGDILDGAFKGYRAVIVFPV